MFQIALNKKMLELRAAKVFALSALTLAMSFSTPAFAALDSIGPIDTNNGFPTTITDTNGVVLGQCLNPIHCAAPTSDLPDPTQPASFPGNYWDEIFWYMAEAPLTFASPNGGAGSALLIMAIEGAYGGGPVVAGDQIMFSRIRFRADGLIPGAAYTVTHPYGTINVTADAAGTVFTTDDCGMGIPGQPAGFVRILDCPIGPFLQVDLVDPAPSELGGFIGPPPAGFIGSIEDMNHITGSPFGTNYLSITGPGLGLNGVSTRLFILVGKISNAPGQSNVLLKKATYSRPLIGQAQAQVFATSSTPTSILTVSNSGGGATPVDCNPLCTSHSVLMEQVIIPGNPLAVPPVADEPTREFFTNINLTPDFAGNLPTSIIISDTTLNPPMNALSASLVDVVTITQATYNQTTAVLTVSATSSDAVTQLSLVLLNLPSGSNEIIGGNLTAVLNAPIDRVTVQSTQGGVATANVILTGPGTTNFKLPDFAAPVAATNGNQVVFVDKRADLSAAASTGTIASYSWVQVANGAPAIAFSNGNTSDIHFLYPAQVPVDALGNPIPFRFRVTVIGPGGISSAFVNVDGVAIPPVIGTVARASAKLGKDEWKTDGSAFPVVPGSTIVSLIVTDGFGNTADIMAGSPPVDVAADGVWAFSSKGTPLTSNLGAGQWTIHAISSTGHAGPTTGVGIQ